MFNQLKRQEALGDPQENWIGRKPGKDEKEHCVPEQAPTTHVRQVMPPSEMLKCLRYETNSSSLSLALGRKYWDVCGGMWVIWPSFTRGTERGTDFIFKYTFLQTNTNQDTFNRDEKYQYKLYQKKKQIYM